MFFLGVFSGLGLEFFGMRIRVFRVDVANESDQET